MLPKRASGQPLALRVQRLPFLDYLPGRGCLWLNMNDLGSWDRQVLQVLITTALMKWYLISSSNKTSKEAFGAPWVQILWVYALDTCHQTLRQERRERLVCLGPEARRLEDSPDLQLVPSPLPHGSPCCPLLPSSHAMYFAIRHHQSLEVSFMFLRAWTLPQ